MQKKYDKKIQEAEVDTFCHNIYFTGRGYD